MLVTSVDDLRLRMLGSGSLFPWLGPALRGALAMTLKNMECRHPPARARHAVPLLYGVSVPCRVWLRPALRAGGAGGGDSPARARERAASAGGRTVLSVSGSGGGGHGDPGPRASHRRARAGAAGHLAGRVGADRASGGVGSLPTPFRADRFGEPDGLRAPALGPAGRSEGGSRALSAAVGVGLTAPLVMMSRDPGGDRRLRQRAKDAEGNAAQPDSWRRTDRRFNVCPTFADLFQISWRLLAELFGRDGDRLPANYLDWMDRATQIATVDHCYEPFRQERWSARREERYPVYGVVGGGIYGDVPGAFLPYLYWAGQLHAGTHRIAGAGSWRIILD